MKDIIVKAPEDVITALQKYAKKRVEHFVLICLDAERKIICKKVIAIGTEHRAMIDMKVIFWEAFGKKASSIIVAHNHPSNNVQPSGDDVFMTQNLESACEIVGLPLLDHIIIGKYSYFSFKEHDLIGKDRDEERKIAQRNPIC